jgi:hypothetical protein
MNEHCRSLQHKRICYFEQNIKDNNILMINEKLIRCGVLSGSLGRAEIIAK